MIVFRAYSLLTFVFAHNEFRTMLLRSRYVMSTLIFLTSNGCPSNPFKKSKANVAFVCSFVLLQKSRFFKGLLQCNRACTSDLYFLGAGQIFKNKHNPRRLNFQHCGSPCCVVFCHGTTLGPAQIKQKQARPASNEFFSPNQHG